MTLFHSRVLTFHRRTGSYVAGRWIEEVDSTFTLEGSVQASSGDKVETFLEGRRFSGSLDFYVDGPLQTYDPKLKTVGDLYVDESGEEWELVLQSGWANGIIPHYEYTAVRRKELSGIKVQEPTTP